MRVSIVCISRAGGKIVVRRLEGGTCRGKDLREGKKIRPSGELTKLAEMDSDAYGGERGGDGGGRGRRADVSRA